jgi:signal transduction histidine kinase
VDQLEEQKRVFQPTALLYLKGAVVHGAGEALGDIEGPWLEVIVPLFEGPSGVPQSWARYWIDGRRVEREWVAIDHHLGRIAGWSAGGGAVALALVLLWAFSRLHRQADDLARANRELLLHTKTAAIGAISAHLIHGLKNPLAGLEGFIAEAPGNEGGDGRSGVAWEEAAETTRRVRRLINEVLDVLRETAADGDYAVPVGELIDAAVSRVNERAVAAEVSITVVPAGQDQAITGNRAALASLVIHNLLENAIEASPSGGEVTLRVERVSGERFRIEISDTGRGLPTAVKQAGFAPVVSTKLGGAGLGLALSHQLARHAGGSLRVIQSDLNGSRFGLELPQESMSALKN